MWTAWFLNSDVIVTVHISIIYVSICVSYMYFCVIFSHVTGVGLSPIDFSDQINFLSLNANLFCVCAIGLENEDIRTMMRGSNMVKVRSSRWQKSRNLRLLEDGLTVWCESTKSSRKAKAQQTCEYC